MLSTGVILHVRGISEAGAGDFKTLIYLSESVVEREFISFRDSGIKTVFWLITKIWV